MVECGMRTILIAWLATACGSSSTDPVVKMEGFKNRACECEDLACMNQVREDMLKWDRALRYPEGEQPSKLSDADSKKIEELGAQVGACMAKYVDPRLAPP